MSTEKPAPFVVLKNGSTWDWKNDDELDGASYGRNTITLKQHADSLAENAAKNYPTSVISVYELKYFFEPQPSQKKTLDAKQDNRRDSSQG